MARGIFPQKRAFQETNLCHGRQARQKLQYLCGDPMLRVLVKLQLEICL